MASSVPAQDPPPPLNQDEVMQDNRREDQDGSLDLSIPPPWVGLKLWMWMTFNETERRAVWAIHCQRERESRRRAAIAARNYWAHGLDEHLALLHPSLSFTSPLSALFQHAQALHMACWFGNGTIGVAYGTASLVTVVAGVVGRWIPPGFGMSVFSEGQFPIELDFARRDGWGVGAIDPRAATDDPALLLPQAEKEFLLMLESIIGHNAWSCPLDELVLDRPAIPEYWRYVRNFVVGLTDRNDLENSSRTSHERRIVDHFVDLLGAIVFRGEEGKAAAEWERHKRVAQLLHKHFEAFPALRAYRNLQREKAVLAGILE